MIAIDEPNEALRNLAAEAALLGAILIDNRIADTVADTLDPADFSEAVHGRIYSEALALLQQGSVANPITLRSRFETDPDMRELGGAAYLAQLTQTGGGLIAYAEFAAEIVDLARRRRMVDALREAMEVAGSDTGRPLAEIAEAADAALNEALSGSTALTGQDVGLAQLFRTSLDEITAEAKGTTAAGVRTASLPDWNDLTGGMRPGEVTILAGRPGMGKTAVSLSVALGAAENGHGVGYFSLEMQAIELGKRMISDLVFDHGNCPSFDDVKRGNFTRDDFSRIGDAERRIAAWPFRVIDQGGVRIGRIAMMARRLKRKMAASGQKLELVVIDYLQLVKADKARQSRYEEVGEVSRAVKQLAKDLGVHVLLLAQVNRECEKREDKRPRLSDLRDAGDIEQDCDNAIFIYRDEVYLAKAEPDQDDQPAKHAAWQTKIGDARSRIEIYTEKRRNGETMKRTCWFFGANQAVRGSRYFEDRR